MQNGHWHKIKAARQRLVLCRLLIDVMRNIHGAYAPAREPFGDRIETFFVGLCVAMGEFDDKPFSVSKVATYMRMSRSTVVRRLTRLQDWGLIYRQGHHYYLHEKALNSLMGMRSYQNVRRLVDEAVSEMSSLDALPEGATSQRAVRERV